MRFADKPEDESGEDVSDLGLMQVGVILQDVDHPLAPMYILMGERLWIIDPQVLESRLLKHNTYKGTMDDLRKEGRMP